MSYYSVRAHDCCNVEGSRGRNGWCGTQGSQGSQGYDGVNGVAGFRGTQGEIGTQGGLGIDIVGDPGSVGSVGARGFDGVHGVQGGVGYPGSRGFRGSAGGIGETGFQGYQGADAFSGGLGDDGSQGSQGFLGSQGSQGLGGAFEFTASTTGKSVIVQDGDTLRLTSLSGILFNLNVGSALVEMKMGNMIRGTGSPVGMVPFNGLKSAIYFDNSSGAMWMWNSDSFEWIQQTSADGLVGPQGIDGKNGLLGNIGNVGPQGQSVPGPQGDPGIGITGSQGYPSAGIQGYQGDLTIGTQGSQGSDGLLGVFHSPYIIHTITFDATTRDLPIDYLVPNSIIEIQNLGGNINLPPTFQILSFLSDGIGMVWTIQCQFAYTIFADDNIFFSANSGISTTTFANSTNFPVASRTSFLFFNKGGQLYATDFEVSPFGSRFREPPVKGVYP